jgi:hypothetical protein
VHDLIALDPPPGRLTIAEIDATVGFAAPAKAAATQVAHETDWQQFAAWAALRGAKALPTHPASQRSGPGKPAQRSGGSRGGRPDRGPEWAARADPAQQDGSGGEGAGIAILLRDRPVFGP